MGNPWNSQTNKKTDQLYTKLKRYSSHKSHYNEKFKPLKSTIQNNLICIFVIPRISHISWYIRPWSQENVLQFFQHKQTEKRSYLGGSDSFRSSVEGQHIQQTIWLHLSKAFATQPHTTRKIKCQHLVIHPCHQSVSQFKELIYYLQVRTPIKLKVRMRSHLGCLKNSTHRFSQLYSKGHWKAVLFPRTGNMP